MVEKLTLNAFEKLMSARQVARAGRIEDRDRLALAGLRIYAKRFTDAGDPASGKRFAEAADAAEKFLKQADAVRTAAEKPVPDFVGDAAANCGKTLFKLMPDAFTDAAGAACWAIANLPMAPATQKANDAAAARRKLSRQAGDARREFSKILDRVAMDVIGTVDTAKAIRELVSVGRGG